MGGGAKPQLIPTPMLLVHVTLPGTPTKNGHDVRLASVPLHWIHVMTKPSGLSGSAPVGGGGDGPDAVEFEAFPKNEDGADIWRAPDDGRPSCRQATWESMGVPE